MTGRAALGAALSLVLLVSSPGLARAEAPDKTRCADAYENAQKLERSGKINDALAEATLCSSSTCPEILRADCSKWLGPLRARQASLLVEAHDASGADLADVRVSVDGVVVREHLDGLAIFVDPGPHTLVLEGPRREQRSIVVREGELGRRVAVTFGSAAPPVPPPAPAPETRRRPIPVASWIFGGAGLVGLGTFAVFGLTGRALDDELGRTCAPTCRDERVERVDTSYVVADIGLGIGVVSLAVATWLALAR